jgi:hypothetical protein
LSSLAQSRPPVTARRFGFKNLLPVEFVNKRSTNLMLAGVAGSSRRSRSARDARCTAAKN